MATEPTNPAASTAIEPAHDILRQRHHPLDVFFSPRTVAIIGATDRAASVGRTVLWNLVSHPFGGTVFPVNPHRQSVLGIQAYTSIATVPAPVELAIVVTPAPTVPGVIGECGDAGVKGAVIISAGFRESGAAGAELEAQILAQARRSRIRVIGPNCLGVMSPATGLNATFANAIAQSGSVAFVSQSGALCTAILDWSLQEHVGFSAFLSVGSMVDVGWGDLIDYLGDDPRTRSIILYMESVGDPRSFLSSVRQVALTKPIIVIKAGRTEAAAKAAASHTGALTGSDEVLDAALHRSGVLRVETIADLFSMAEVLAKQPHPRGPRLMIVTNAGGPGVLAVDAVVHYGGQLAELSSKTLEALNQLLPPHWSHNNPIDVLGDADPERYAKTVEIAARDPNSDGLLVILAPQGMTDPTQTAEQVKAYARLEGKPILASWMGGQYTARGEAILARASIPTFSYPESAVRAFQYMWRYSCNLRGLYETPSLADTAIDSAGRERIKRMIQEVRSAGRTLLTEFESKNLLHAYGIPAAETRLATSKDDAIRAAEAIGYPVVLKVHSQTIAHKADVGGVRLNVGDAAAVRQAYGEIESAVQAKAGAGNFLGVTVQPMIRWDGYEIIIGSAIDPQFGPVLLFGAGGHLVEVFQDRALALPPLTTTLARRLMEQTRIFQALGGIRGRKPVDLGALEQLLVRFSQLVIEQPWIKEIDINPLLASSEGLVALDARVVLQPREFKEAELPKPAIRPYPTQYMSAWTAKDGTPLLIRPIRPEDEPLIARFHGRLSERSVYLRYFHLMSLSQRVAHERLTRICFIDYDREMALVAEYKDPQTGESEIVAVGRLSRAPWANEAELAILVADNLQKRGLGSEFIRRLIDVGRQEKLHRITAELLSENDEMQYLCKKHGFRLEHSLKDSVIKAEIDLEAKYPANV